MRSGATEKATNSHREADVPYILWESFRKGTVRKDIREESSAPVQTLCADRGAEGIGKGLREALHIGMVLRFYHHAGELLSAGIAENHAAVLA